MANHVSHASLPYVIKGARFTIPVPYLDADGDPTDPTTPDTEFSLDASSFADCGEEVTTITGSNGVGYITLTGAETNGSLLAVVAKVASGPKNTILTAGVPQLVSLGTGTLAAGSAGGGTLGTIIPFNLAGCFLKTTGGTGGGGTGGANNQARRIITYVPSTGVLTVSPNWETTPSTDTTYDILLPDGVTIADLTGSAFAYGTLSGTHSSTTGDLGAAAPAGDVAGFVLHIPARSLTALIDSYNTGTGVATFSPSTATTLTNGDAWILYPAPKASTGNPVAANATQFAGQTITAAAGVTLPSSVASPTNITAGTITTVTNLTNAPTAGDLTSTMKASIFTTALTEAYAADGAAGTLSQILFGIQAFLQERSTSGTTVTVKKLDGSTTAFTFTISDATSPVSITRAT